MNPKILLQKNKEREIGVSEEKGRSRRKEKKKKAMAALLVFMLTSV